MARGKFASSQVVLPVPRGPRRKKELDGGWRSLVYIVVILRRKLTADGI